jgi:hypothetical protein
MPAEQRERDYEHDCVRCQLFDRLEPSLGQPIGAERFVARTHLGVAQRVGDRRDAIRSERLVPEDVRTRRGFGRRGPERLQRSQ